MTTPTPPAVTLPGTFSIPAVAPLYVDGIRIDAAVAGASLPRVIPGGPNQPRQQTSQDFWSTDLRPAGDPTWEQLQISLSQIRQINYMTLDLPHFPHRAVFYYWDGDAWSQLARSNGAPFEIITTGSTPTIVDNPAALNAGLNPYHYGAGHWDHHDEPLARVETSKILMRLQRLSQASGHQKFPVSPRGNPVPYPLGARNLDFGLRILACSDAPYTLRDPYVLSQRLPFATSVDVHGSPIQAVIRQNRASDLLRAQ